MQSMKLYLFQWTYYAWIGLMNIFYLNYLSKEKRAEEALKKYTAYMNKGNQNFAGEIIRIYYNKMKWDEREYLIRTLDRWYCCEYFPRKNNLLNEEENISCNIPVQ